MVMEQASIFPETGLNVEAETEEAEPQGEDLEAFRDFVDTLDLDDL